MSRDYRSEILIALIIAVILILVLVVAVLLAVVTGGDAQTTVSAEVTETAIVISELAPETRVTSTVVRSTTISPSATPTASVTASASPSSTSLPADTPTIVITTQPAPTGTDTEQASEQVIITATATVTRRPTQVVRETQMPTARPTSTSTPSSTATFTVSPVATDLPTATPTPTLRPRSTRVVVPTATLGILATDTRVPFASVDAIASPTLCLPPSGWVPFTVRSGDTLASIARATRTSIEDLRSGNCIEDVNRLQAGQTLYAPRMPQRIVNPAGGLAAKGCQNINALINTPRPGQRVRGIFQVFGSAASTGTEGFIRYQLDIRQDGSADYQFYSENRQEVRSGVLGEIDTTRFGTGVFWLRLVIVDGSGGVSESNMCEIPLYFE